MKDGKQIIGAIDIDGVLATKLENGKYPDDYEKKQVIEGAVASLRSLRAMGHKIILFTSRFEIDRDVTEEWLRKNGFSGLYDELIMDKPQFDYMVDDRAIRFENWQKTIEEIYNRHRTGNWY